MENKYSICDKIFILLIPVVVSACVTYVVDKLAIKFEYKCGPELGSNLSQMMINVWGTLFGFLLSAESILLTLGGKKYLKALRESVHYRTILFAYFVASFHTLIAMAVFITIVFMNTWSDSLMMVLVFFTCDTILLLLLCLWFLYKLIMKSTE